MASLNHACRGHEVIEPSIDSKVEGIDNAPAGCPTPRKLRVWDPAVAQVASLGCDAAPRARLNSCNLSTATVPSF
jgi:hypothetical protein